MEIKVNNRGNVSYWENGEMVKKQCSKCKLILPVSRFQKRKTGEYYSNCKLCGKKYFLEHPEAKKEAQEKWLNKNNSYYSDYHNKHKEERNKYSSEYVSKKKGSEIKAIEEIKGEIDPIFKEFDLPVYGYIYKITHKKGHCYIGQTTNPIFYRYGSDIIKTWIKERKENASQKFIEELKKEDFTIEALNIACCEYHLNRLEVYYIDKYNSFFNGYNCNNGMSKSIKGIEEFNKILQENNLIFENGQLRRK
jgi:uncharacterized Zn finger protein (UPF0148 family)